MLTKEFVVGETLISQGAPPHQPHLMSAAYGDWGCWFIEEGEADVFAAGASGQAAQIGRVGAGSVVGELALIGPGLPVPTVRARTPVTASRITLDDVAAMTSQCQPLALYLLDSAIAALRGVYGAPPQEPIGAGARISAFRGHNKLFPRRVIEPNAVIFQQGDPGTTAFLILSGAVSIVQSVPTGLRVLASLPPGRIFGELALFSDEPRRASAIATKRTVCEVVPKTEVRDSLASMPPALRALTMLLINRLTTIPAAHRNVA